MFYHTREINVCISFFMFGGHKREKQCTCLKSDLCSPKITTVLGFISNSLPSSFQLTVSSHLLFNFHVPFTVSAAVTLQPAAFCFFRVLLKGQNAGMTLIQSKSMKEEKSKFRLLSKSD